eukprot:5680891-Amphidinium_carterae.1
MAWIVAEDIKRLLKAKTALLESYKGTSNPTTCVEIIEEVACATWGRRLSGNPPMYLPNTKYY